MRRSLAFALALVLAVVLAVAFAAPSPLAAQDAGEEAVRAAEQAFADAFARRDRAAFVAAIHPDAVFGGQGGPLRGRDEVMSEWDRLLEPEEPPFSWRPARVLVGAGGDLAMTTGPVFDPDGNHVGAFSSTWQRQEDGTWKVVFDLGPPCPRNAPPPAEEAPPAPPDDASPAAADAPAD